MSSVTVEEAQAHLPQLIEKLQPGEALVITRDEKPVGRLLAEGPPGGSPAGPAIVRG